jgi:phospholipase/carboxylesterase
MPIQPLFSATAPYSGHQSSNIPLLVFLHGRGSDEQDLLGLTPSFDPRFLAVSIRAPYRFPQGGYTWFDLGDQGGVNIDQVLESADALLLTLDDIQKKHPIDPHRIFLFGFSMGAMMAFLLSLRYPDRFQGVVAHSGLLLLQEHFPYEKERLAGLKLFIAHGTEDPIVPIHFGRTAQQWFAKTGAQLTYREYPIPHSISDESLNDTSRWLQAFL